MESNEDEQAEDERDIIEPTEFDTLELTLEEARRRYDNEEARRDTVEGKIGTVVTVNALIISFGGLFSSLNTILVLSVLFPAVLSAGMGLYGIRSRIYGKPGYDIEDFHDYAEMDVAEQQEHFLLSYEVTTGKNADLNTRKFSIFNYCIGYTFVSFLLALAAPLLQRFGVVEWAGNLSTQCFLLLGVVVILVISLLPPLVIYLTLESQRGGS